MLTRKEKEIYDLIIDGKTNQEIAQALYIAYKTTKNHIYSIYDKLGCKDRIELIVKHYKGELN